MDQSKLTKEQFGTMVKKASPNSRLFSDSLKAFFVGGAICGVSQIYMNLLANIGFSKDETAMITSITLIFLAVALTGIGVYDSIGKFAGAGSVVPITGFANSIAAPAIEFKKEGFILGVGAKMFIVAGPVILYGILTSVGVGLIYYFIK